ncbi:13940_t:CDS:2 [Funneliformis mosseae]|uniref:13940_t:CDS:1 n=1 Tax=Funneliformis mosseae TaxID=27381 RepID=A0A9N9GU13_FUNMO|nr:13940_t:CDS:2 [Funneliformis mosseae]
MSNEINETKETVEKRLKKRNIKRAKVLGAYSEEEDRQLLNLFSQYSNKINKWRMFDMLIIWTQRVLDKDPLTEDEKLKINSLQDDPPYYKKWAKITEELSKDKKFRRTELQIKNYWNGKARSQGRSMERIRSKMRVDYIYK